MNPAMLFSDHITFKQDVPMAEGNGFSLLKEIRLLSAVAFCLLLVLLSDSRVLATNVNISGSCGSEGENVIWFLDNTGQMVISGHGDMFNYSFEGEDIPWKDLKDSIVSLKINEGVTSIGDYSFSDCSYLVEVEIADTLTHIGVAAFEGCNNLETLVLPDGVNTISDFAFSWCNRLHNVTLPQKCDYLGQGAFESCSIREIQIPEGIESIEEGTFKFCEGLQSVTIPSSVRTIQAEAFEDCDSLLEIIIPDSVRMIGEEAFSGCSNLNNLILPNQLESIGDSAFSFCTTLDNIVIPGSVKCIGRNAFEFCDSLRNVVLLEGVSTIEDYAFSLCDSLEAIMIPKSVSGIEAEALDRDDPKPTIYGEGGTYAEEWASLNGFPFEENMDKSEWSKSSESNEISDDMGWYEDAASDEQIGTQEPTYPRDSNHLQNETIEHNIGGTKQNDYQKLDFSERYSSGKIVAILFVVAGGAAVLLFLKKKLM